MEPDNTAPADGGQPDVPLGHQTEPPADANKPDASLGQQTAPAADSSKQTAPATNSSKPTAPATNPNKPADAAADEGKKGEESEKSPLVGAPEGEYGEFKVPEGFDKLDEALLGQFTPLAKSMNLSQEGAQKLVDMFATSLTQRAEEQSKQWADQVKGWLSEAKADKDFGGDKWDASLATANKGIDAFGDKEFREILATTGLGNHPAVIRFCHKVGKATEDDTFISGRHNPAAPRSAADVLFGSSAKA